MRLSLQSRSGVRVAAAAALLCVFAFVPALARAAITTNPANRPLLLSEPIEELHYDYAKSCLSHPQPGTLALQSWLEDNWPGVSWGIMRCEKLSPHNYSLHDQDGNEAALARRMGVQGLIFNCRQWFGYGDRLSPYSYCYRRDGKLRKHLDRTSAHRDHIHIELNWAGARKRTSFWHSPLAP